MLCLAALFLLALVPRLYSAQTVGWGWDYPGSFTLVNFDEGGSCRAALEGFDYTPFIGHQTIAIASALDSPPPPDIAGDHTAVKRYCHSPGHLLVARSYSAVTGALTAVLTAVIGLLLMPGRPAVGWTAGALVALSGFHIAESFSGTVDAPSVFFIYLFLAVLIFAVRAPSRLALGASPVLLVAAVWTKYWVFAALAYLALLPERLWRYVSHGFGAGRIVALLVGTALLFGLMSIYDFRAAGLYPVMAAWYLLIPWRRIRRGMIAPWLLVPPLVWAICQIDLVAAYTLGSQHGRFGTAYGAIGWHKLPRNLLNLPLVLLVGLGLPAWLFLPAGLRAIVRDPGNARAWCCLLPVLAFALFMLFVSPVTYYRHYLPLLPAAALVAACGLFATPRGRRLWPAALVLVWQAALAVDLVADYHRDPRIELRAWYARHPDARVFTSYYVNPPPGHNMLFRPEYAMGDAATLRRGDFLVLSENWYDTAFVNELNGPLVGDPGRLVKTKPSYTAFYRDAIAGRHPHLDPQATLAVNNFMPELVLHKRFYGTFQLFVGDIRVFRVVH
ncbi:MAG: hypothetical protein U5K56_11620 [Halioglobus sp.]|nr:hypothetical protein [Halioglobus sp.]